MNGCVDLGINTAYLAQTLVSDPLYKKRFIAEPNLLNGNGVPNTKQALPEWGSARRENKIWEPYPLWIGPSGMWADGPAMYSGWATWQVVNMGGSNGGFTVFASSHGGCNHLTCAANCTLDAKRQTITVGTIHDFYVRPYWWSELAVQNAYETVSAGEIQASEIQRLADVGKIEQVDGHYVYGPTPSGEEEDFIREAHEYDSDVAKYLCFGVRNKRPFCWHNKKWADSKMAPDNPFAGYEMPSVQAHGRTSYFSRESHRRGIAGQGFMALRRVDSEMFQGDSGALGPEDWGRVGYAIAHSWNAPKHIEQKEVDGETVRVRKLDIGTMGRPNRSNEAFDVRISKTVILTRGKWRTDQNGAPIQHGSPGKPAIVLGKEFAKRYDINAWWISGARPKNEVGRQTFPFITPDPEYDPTDRESQKQESRWQWHLGGLQ